MTDYALKSKVLQHMLSQQRNSDPDTDGTIWYKEHGLYRPIQVADSSAKGGVGKTTLAAWLAYLAAKSGLKTALVELNWINNPNLASIVFQDIKKNENGVRSITSFVTKEGIDIKAYSRSESCSSLNYFLIRHDDWVGGRTIDSDEETVKTQLMLVEGFRDSPYGIVIYDFPNYASKQKGLEPLIATDSRIIFSERGDAAMGTVPKIVQEIINLTGKNYLEETQKQKLLVVNRIEEESSTIKRLLAKPLKELKIDKAYRDVERLKERLPEKNFFGEFIYFIQEKLEIKEAAGPGNIMSLSGEDIKQFKSTTQNLLADIIVYAINRQKKEKESK